MLALQVPTTKKSDQTKDTANTENDTEEETDVDGHRLSLVFSMRRHSPAPCKCSAPEKEDEERQRQTKRATRRKGEERESSS